MKQIWRKIVYNFSFLGVFFSPLRGLKLKWYFGEIKHGTPIFLPRKLVNYTRQDAIDKLNKDVHNGKFLVYPNEVYIKENMTIRKFVPIKYFGFKFTPLGWKTKWDEFRFEWNPSISLVIFGKQLYIEILPNIDSDDYRISIDCYWECWLTYYYRTDKNKKIEERLTQLMDKYSCVWGNENNGYFNYYNVILKSKYKKHIIQ